MSIRILKVWIDLHAVTVVVAAQGVSGGKAEDRTKTGDTGRLISKLKRRFKLPKNLPRLFTRCRCEKTEVRWKIGPNQTTGCRNV